MNAPDVRTQSAAHRVAQLAAGDVLTQDDRDAIVRLVGELDDRWSEQAAPAADLPATLAAVDDVRRVCEVAGLSRAGDDAWGVRSGEAHVSTDSHPDDGLYVVEVERFGTAAHLATLYPDAPSSLLWHAIQAARSAS